jgi:integrase
MQPYRVRRILYESGERLPILIDTRTGLPVVSVLSYILSNLRGNGQAVNTIEQFCRVMALFHYWLEYAKVNFLKRCMTGEFLQQVEVEQLGTLFQLKAKDFINVVPTLFAPKVEAKTVRISKVVNLEKFRKAPARQKALPQVSSSTQSVRLQHTQAYLCQLIVDYSERATTSFERRDVLRVAHGLLAKKFKALCPSKNISRDTPAPEGLPQSQVDLLLKVIDPGSDNTRNPWKGSFVRHRNQLMVLTLLATGMRGGELLKMKTSQLSRHDTAISIQRTPDDAEDPRRLQPQAKTEERVLLIDTTLYTHINEFILNHRRAIPARQRNHPFIWVAVNGAPLSMASLYKMFADLRTAEPALTEALCAHLLRYTASDDLFNQLSDEQCAEEESDHSTAQMRYVLGWSENSKMPEKYAKRAIRKKANHALLTIQANLIKRNADHNQ